ncbi:MAG: hypothetical protein ACRDNW_23185 [Trebonia sp.]
MSLTSEHFTRLLHHMDANGCATLTPAADPDTSPRSSNPPPHDQPPVIIAGVFSAA